MIVLAIDTASRSCSAAVLEGSAILAEISDAGGQTHSRHLMTMIDRVIGMTVGHPARIDGFAVTRGPGSFTGLRIGIGAAKGLAMAVGKPLVGISSLEVLAWQAWPSAGLILPMLDARRKEVYTARYRRFAQGLSCVAEEAALAPEAAVAGVNEPCVLIGDGAAAYAERLAAVLGPWMHLAPAYLHPIRASTVGWLARERLEAAQDDSTVLVPRYLRPSYAEAKLPPIGIDNH